MSNKKTTEEIIKSYDKNKQIEIINNALNGEEKCLQCGKTTYLLCDTEKTADIISHVVVCTSCLDSLVVDISRDTGEIISCVSCQ